MTQSWLGLERKSLREFEDIQPAAVLSAHADERHNLSQTAVQCCHKAKEKEIWFKLFQNETSLQESLKDKRTKAEYIVEERLNNLQAQNSQRRKTANATWEISLLNTRC